MDLNHSVYLFDLLLNPTLRYRKARRSRPSILAKSYIGFKQRYIDGIRYIPHHYFWNDHVAVSRSKDH